MLKQFITNIDNFFDTLQAGPNVLFWGSCTLLEMVVWESMEYNQSVVAVLLSTHLLESVQCSVVNFCVCAYN